MKKTFVVLASGLLLTLGAGVMGCGSGADEKAATADTAAAEAPVAAADPAIQEGLELVGQSDCLTCHKINEPSIGPAYTAVAEKYANNQAGRDSLAQKIIKGGSGNWGQVAMTPHPQVKEEDARKMVAYIMSLKPGM